MVERKIPPELSGEQVNDNATAAERLVGAAREQATQAADALRRGAQVCDTIGADLLEVDYHELAGLDLATARAEIGLPAPGRRWSARTSMAIRSCSSSAGSGRRATRTGWIRTR